MKKRIFFVLTAVILLLGAFAINATAAEELADVYVATTGIDTNAGTADAPVQSLNQALALVQDGGTVHIVDSYTAPAGFVWENHGKDVTITGGKLDLSQGYSEGEDGGSPFYYYAQGDAVTYDNLELVLADDLYYFANGFRLQVNENVTISGKDLQLFGGGFKTAVASTNMKLLGGSYLCDDGYASIYGGGYKANVNGDVNLYVGNINPTYTTSHDGKTRLYGGGYVYSGTNQISGDINLTVAGANVDRVCGVSHVNSAVSGDVNVRMTGGSVYSLIGGGGGTCTIAGDINLTMTGGTVAQVFGANEGASHTGNVTVLLQGGTITRRFHGGCYNNYEILSGYTGDNHVIGNIDVLLGEGMNFSWNTSEEDAGFYVHSRYNPLFDEEVANLYYMNAKAQTKHEGNLGSRNSGMSWIMGSSTAVADNTYTLTRVKKWNIILGDDIGANFYLDVPAGIADLSQLKVIFDGETKTYDLSKQKATDEGLYLIPVDVAVAQMTEDITLQLVVNGVECEPAVYTVRKYAEGVLSGEYGEFSEQIQNLLKHLLNFGAKGQTYFKTNTDDMANASYPLDYTATYPADYPQLAVDGQISGVSFYGTSLIMESRIAVRYYFTADSVEGITFTANGRNYTAVQKGSMYYVEVPGILPHEYGDSIMLSAVKGGETMTVSYSPLTYIVRKSTSTNTNLQALVNAMYGYYEAAFAYVNGNAATVKLLAATGGTMTTAQNVYQVGDTVTITATPEEGYNLTGLTVTKDGQSIDIGEVTFAGGEYSFTAEQGSYTVQATFTEKIFLESDHYDVTNQYNGTVTLLAGSTGSRTVSTYANTYRDMAVTIRDLVPDTTTWYSAELHFNFTNGNVYMIRVEKNNGKYRVQNMDPDIVSSWPTVYWFDDAQTAKLQGEEGIEFRVTIHGTNAYIYLDGVCVATQDLSAGITAETTAQVDLVMYRNITTQPLEIPFTLNSDPIAATVTASAENGTVKMDKESYVAGETVTVTATPNKLYNLTELTVKKDGEVVKSFETTYEGGNYTFATTEAGEYTVEATFTRDHLIAAPDTNYILHSAKLDMQGTYVGRNDQSTMKTDLPSVATVLNDAVDQFNKTGEEWNWFAYKINVPADGTYTLGVKTSGSKYESYKLPLCVNGEVYALQYTAKAQEVTTEVTLPAGEHIVTVFWPMPDTKPASTVNEWNAYHWCNIESVTVDYALEVSKPTAAEVEAEVKPNTVIAATDAATVLWSAAMVDNGSGYLEFNSRDAVKADMPYIESLYSDAFDQFNSSGEEWGWIAYKVTAPADGRYTLKLQMQNCRNAPYYMPLCVNGEVYTLSYAATGRQSASANVTLSAGEHVVVVFMPMPVNADNKNGADYVDYPWANPEQITVDGMLTVSLPTVEEVEDSFYTTINGGDETKVLFNKFSDNGDTLGSVSAGDIRWDKPTIDMLPYGSNYLSRWPYASVKVTAEKTGTYQILVNADVNTATKSAQLGMLVDGTAYSVPFEVASTTKMKIAVDLTAGEHVITFFMPMPKDHTAAFAGDSYYYPWMNCNSILFEHGITEISKPTVQEIQAHMLSYVPATDSGSILWSAAMGSTTANNVNILNCANQAGMRADMPYIDSLITNANGQFNKSGEEWNWFAYQVSVPKAGTYSLGVMTQDIKFANSKMPMYVNGQVYTLSFSAKTQAVTADVTLPAGEHVVVVFAPMPQNADSAQNNVWNDYQYANYRAVIVDSALTVSLPDIAEVEGAFLPDQQISAVDTEQILLSATIKQNAEALGRTDQATLGVDWPTIETLYTDASGQFNKSGEEWNWFAYKINVPYDGVYTLGAKTVNAKFANYLIPLCVNGETYTLKYTAKSQEVTTRMTLPAGEHTVVMFMPMRATKANIEGNASNDYCWCDVGSVIVDGELTVSLPTVAEVEAVFAPEVYSATDTSLVLRSATVKYAAGNAFVERGNYDFVSADAPRIDTLLEAAPGQFNAPGEEWIWMAYKVDIPVDGTYTLGVTTVGAGRDSFKIPMVVDGEVYTLAFTAKAQTVTAEVTLPAGEHVVTVFWPMPASESEVSASGAWYNYTWANIASVTVDYSLEITAPTVEEVEACFPVTTEETT